MTLPLNE